MVQQLTLYTASVCPFAQRVEIALAETGLDFTRYEIDLANKPEWYAPKVNPASKVPALAVGGPNVDPADPSPDSKKITESLVLVDLVNDFSNGALLPTDPIQRADARFFISQVSDVLIPAYVRALFKQNVELVLPAVEKIQALLPPEGYALGQQYTTADVAVVPFLIRLKLVLELLGKFVPANLDTLKTLETDPKFARYRKYFDDVTSRESFKKTWKEDLVRPRLEARIALDFEQNETA